MASPSRSAVSLPDQPLRQQGLPGSPSQPIQVPPHVQPAALTIPMQLLLPPPPLIPSSDSALTHLPSLHPGRLDAGLLLVGLTGRGLCSSRALMGRINWVSFQLNVADCLNELWIQRKTHTLQKTGNFHL